MEKVERQGRGSNRVITCSKSRSALAGGVADPDPDAARAGLIGAINLLRYDTLGPKPARMHKNGRAVLGRMFAVSRVVGQISLTAFQKPSAPT
jgi:hypothetical protein